MSIYAALIAAQAEAKTVPKDGHNKHFGFDFTKADTMYRTGKQILNKHSLCLIPLTMKITQHTVNEVVVTKTGREVVELPAYDVTRTFRLAHDSGEVIDYDMTWPVDVAGKKSRDKSVAATDTTLLGYAYRDLLSMGRMGEGEVDAVEPSKQEVIKAEALQLQADRAAVKLAQADRVIDDAKKRGAVAVAKELDEAEAELRGGKVVRDTTKESSSQDELLKGSVKVLGTAADLLSKDDFEAAGWDPDVAEEIGEFHNAAVMSRTTVNHLAKLCTAKHGLKGKEAKAKLIATFGDVGVDVANKQTPTGLQLKQWAALCLLPF